MPEVAAYAVDSPTGDYHPTTITRREPGPTEVFFDIHYAGICHSDIHTARGEWGRVNYPLVPGHEIAGIVSKVGSEVTKFRAGDRVGVSVQARPLTARSRADSWLVVGTVHPLATPTPPALLRLLPNPVFDRLLAGRPRKHREGEGR